jgi:hypothetical protein
MKVQGLTPILNVSSLEESFAWFEKMGWRKVFDWVTCPPTDMPWGMRECHIRHPDGHTFRVGAGREEE